MSTGEAGQRWVRPSREQAHAPPEGAGSPESARPQSPGCAPRRDARPCFTEALLVLKGPKAWRANPSFRISLRATWNLLAPAEKEVKGELDAEKAEGGCPLRGV